MPRKEEQDVEDITEDEPVIKKSKRSTTKNTSSKKSKKKVEIPEFEEDEQEKEFELNLDDQPVEEEEEPVVKKSKFRRPRNSDDEKPSGQYTKCNKTIDTMRIHEILKFMISKGRAVMNPVLRFRMADTLDELNGKSSGNPIRTRNTTHYDSMERPPITCVIDDMTIESIIIHLILRGRDEMNPVLKNRMIDLINELYGRIPIVASTPRKRPQNKSIHRVPQDRNNERERKPPNRQPSVLNKKPPVRPNRANVKQQVFDDDN